LEATLELDKEMITTFQDEANEIIAELRDVIDALEDSTDKFPKELLEDFANKTDRLMGSAKTFETMYSGAPVFNQIGKFAELCKATGYKASTLNHQGLIPIFAAFWADTLDILEDLVKYCDDPAKIAEVKKTYIPTLQKRLVWLAQQIVTLTKGSGVESKINVDGLLKRMGIDI